MRKLFWLFMMFLLAGCGSGGSGVSGSSAPVTGDGTPSVATGTGTVSLQFVNGTTQASAKTVAALTPTNAGRVRIVVSNATFKKIVDLPFGGPAPVVTLPVGLAYTAEAVYYENGTPNRLTQHGKSLPFDVQFDTSTAAEVVMTDIASTVSITPPANVFSGETYTVTASTATVLDAAGLQPAWSLAVAKTTGFISPPDVLDPFTNSVHLAQAPTALHEGIAAPITDQAGRLYFQGEFFMKAALLDAGETATNWSFSVQPVSSTELKVVSVATLTLPPDTADPQITSFSVPATKQGTTTIAPISIAATDNAGIAGYAITTIATPPDGTVDAQWLPTAPTSYLYTGSLPNGNGSDNPVTLYAWVRDYSDRVSAASVTTTKSVIINNSPVVKTFIVPSAAQFGTTIPVTITGTNYTGENSALFYLVTENSIAPLASAFPAVAGAPTSYNVTSVTQLSGTKYTVQLYAWVKDANGSVSQALRNVVTINDIPQVTSFTVLTSVPNGNVVDILSFIGAAKIPWTIPDDGYLITTTNSTPTTGVFSTKPATFSYPYATATTAGLTVGVAATKNIYAWVKDSNGAISLAKTVSVRFNAP